MNRRSSSLALFAVLLAAVLQAAAARADETAAEATRFASIKPDRVNVRAGPGKQYPVRWVFVRPGVPVEILAEYDHWRKIRDWEGQEGWVHRAMLSGRRNVIVTGSTRTLYRRADETSPPVVTLEPGIVAAIEDCTVEWCRVEVRNYRGWLRRSDFWGVHPGETID